MSSAQTPARGRPRLMPRRRVGGTPQDEILDAAGELFTEHGYAGTSTRAIAEAVGLRQASLYHHFATKEDILIALLRQTVVPTLDLARAQDADRPAWERLVEVIRFDVAQLVTSRWNLGVLYLLPEIRTATFDAFRSDRLALRDLYRALAADVIGAGDDDPRSSLPFRLVESVIGLRSDGEVVEGDAAALAETVVTAAERILGVDSRG